MKSCIGQHGAWPTYCKNGDNISRSTYLVRDPEDAIIAKGMVQLSHELPCPHPATIAPVTIPFCVTPGISNLHQSEVVFFKDVEHRILAARPLYSLLLLKCVPPPNKYFLFTWLS